MSETLKESFEETEKGIEAILERETKLLSIRSGTRWHEQVERNYAYFNTLRTPIQTQSISSLIHPVTGKIEDTATGLISSATAFYTQLYTPETRDQAASISLLTAIDDSLKIPKKQHEDLMRLTDKSELHLVNSEAPKSKGSGLDDLPAEVYALLMQHPYTADLLIEVMNNTFLSKYPKPGKKQGSCY
jgi:hypothetical protein